MCHSLVKKQMESSLQEFHVSCSAEVNLPTTRPTDAHVLEDPHLHVPPQQRPLLAANNCTTLSLDGKIWSLLKRENILFNDEKYSGKYGKASRGTRPEYLRQPQAPPSQLWEVFMRKMSDCVFKKNSCCWIVVSLMSGWHDFPEALDAI